jgi:hypothetical protein
MIVKETSTQLEQYFQQFRENIIGIDQNFVSYGKQKSSILIGLLVADFIVPEEN